MHQYITTHVYSSLDLVFVTLGIKLSSYVVEKDLGHTIVLYKHSR